MEEKKQENQFSGMTREEIILEAKKQILHSAVLALAALIVIAVACYAWFVSTKTVTANVGTVSMGDMTFELASAGQLSAFDTPADYTVPTGEEYSILPDLTGRWTFRHQTIQWQMTDEANLENDTVEKGLRPGSHGHLSFYVIPKGTGPLKVRFDLEIVPLKETVNNNTTEWKDADTTAANLLRGHLLFACPQKYSDGKLSENDRGMTLANYSDGSFTIDFGKVTANTPIAVTLNWFWPQTLKDVVDSAQYGSTVSKWMTENPTWFFYNEENTVTVDTVSSTDKTLNDYFNNADKYIGDSIDAMILRLNADKVS